MHVMLHDSRRLEHNATVVPARHSSKRIADGMRGWNRYGQSAAAPGIRLPSATANPAPHSRIKTNTKALDVMLVDLQVLLSNCRL